MRFHNFVLSMAALVLVGCVSPAPRMPAGTPTTVAVAGSNASYVPALKDGKPWRADDPALKRGDLTIWTLQHMAQSGQYEALNQLFNHGLTLESLPIGYAAGTGAPWPDQAGFIKAVADSLTGANWRGKIFFNSFNPRASHGLNRILKFPPGLQVTPSAAFKTYLLNPGGNGKQFDQPELEKGITSNFVILNYAHPDSGSNFLVENALKQIQVYDVMVAVPGKNGPIYVGKTWLGKYDPKTAVFHANKADELIAWYFLDFNSETLQEQESMLKGQAKEVKIPFVDKKH